MWSNLSPPILAGMFDREAFEGPYVLQVTVTDNGVGMSLTGTAEVTVYLADVNDNDPIFQPSELQPAMCPVVINGQLCPLSNILSDTG